MRYKTDDGREAVSFVSTSTGVSGCFLLRPGQDVDKWCRERDFAARVSNAAPMPPMWASWHGVLAERPATEQAGWPAYREGEYTLPGVSARQGWHGLDPSLCSYCGEYRAGSAGYECPSCGAC